MVMRGSENEVCQDISDINRTEDSNPCDSMPYLVNVMVC